MIDLGLQLSPSFTLGELAVCGDWKRWQTAQIDGLSSFPGSGPRDRVSDRLGALCLTILQPIRDHVGVPVIITSGYRCYGKNAATPGSSPTTQHTKGEAADIRVRGYTDQQLRGLWSWIAFESKLPFGQVIFEDARPDVEGGAWIHVSLGAPYRPASKCGMRLTWDPVNKYRSA